MIETIVDIVGVISLPVIGFGLVYFASITIVGTRQMARSRREAGIGRTEYGRRPDPDPEAPDRYQVYFLVAALNEAAVIGDTITALLAQSSTASVVVVDDGSDDNTGRLARAALGDRGAVVTRRLPDARHGKGRALNAGFAAIVADATQRDLDPNQVLVCVMDADGRLSPDTLGYVCPLFDDSEVGAAQLAVRIRNRHKLLTMIQDYEFWALSATYQQGRIGTRTVSLGGNGQFARLSALVGLGRDPWSDSLTEDLDLSISLAVAGWALTTTPWAHVDQEGIEDIRRLVRQRTRWTQGHMTAAKRIPEIWRSSLPHNRAFELASYLAVPYVTVLPWSVIYPVAMYYGIHFVADPPVDLRFFGSALGGRIVLILLYYIVSFLPNIVYGQIYYHRDRQVGRLRAMAITHSLVVANLIAYAACWRAIGRMITGRTGWAKTAREAAAPSGALPGRPTWNPTRAEVDSTWQELVTGVYATEEWDWNWLVDDLDRDAAAWNDSSTPRRQPIGPRRNDRPGEHHVQMEPMFGSVSVDSLSGEYLYTPSPDAPNGTIDVFQLGVTRPFPDLPSTYAELLSELRDGWVRVLIEDRAATVISASTDVGPRRRSGDAAIQSSSPMSSSASNGVPSRIDDSRSLTWQT